ncbi:MAG: mechanosensitive ion channel family protein [Bacteroidales bacterium]|jgi:miniconductance mechanosensitive channel
MMKFTERWVEAVLMRWGVAEAVAVNLRLVVLIVAAGLLALILFWIMKHLVIKGIYRFFLKTNFSWDDALVKFQVFNHVAHLIPAIVLRGALQMIFRDFPNLLQWVNKITDIYLIIVFILIVNAFLRLGHYALGQTAAFKDKPIAGLFQLIRIILYIATGVLILSILLNKSPAVFLGVFGTMTAVMMLIFKDTILGLVASIQMATGDTVRVGDWIEMPKFGADGDVVSINLTSVRVMNFDKTVTTIPTHNFLTESFKNWRFMSESGSRRIKRAIYINVRTVKFIDEEIRENYKKIHLIADYVEERQTEIDAYNAEHQIDVEYDINGRRMTNIGSFRIYLKNYLRNRPDIRKDMTLMVRQLSIEDKGIPMEIYCFTNTSVWIEYEGIVASIFDHILAAAEFFDLEIYQQPTGSDYAQPWENISHQVEKRLNP